MLNHSELHRFDKVLFSVYFFSQVEMMIIDARIQRRNTPNAKSVPMFALYLRLNHNIAKGSKSRATDNSPHQLSQIQFVQLTVIQVTIGVITTDKHYGIA